MSFSRRRFLKAGTIVTVAAGIPISLARFVAGQQPASDMSSGSTLAVSGDFQPDALSYLRQSSFEPYVNSIFVVQGSRSDAAANVVLQSVIDLITRPKIKLGRTGRFVAPETNGRECFVLSFAMTRECSSNRMSMMCSTQLWATFAC